MIFSNSYTLLRGTLLPKKDLKLNCGTIAWYHQAHSDFDTGKSSGFYFLSLTENSFLRQLSSFKVAFEFKYH